MHTAQSGTPAEPSQGSEARTSDGAWLSQTQPNAAELSQTQLTCRSRRIHNGGFWPPVAQAICQAAFPWP